MKKENKNIEALIEGYILDKLSKEELVTFNKLLIKNPDLKEDVLLEKSVYESLNEDKWSLLKNDSKNEELQQLKKQLRNDDIQQLVEKIKNAEKNHFSQKEKTKTLFNRKYFYFVGAAVVILFLFNLLLNPQKANYYQEYENWNNLPSLIEKGIDKNIIVESEVLYKDKKYKQLILLINSKITKKNDYYSYALIYLGSAYFKLKKFEKAHQTFDELIQTNSLQNSYGYWYKLLIYLKTNDKVNTDKMINLILKNKEHYNYKKVKKLYTELH